MRNLKVLLRHIVIDLLVVEAREGRLNTMSLSHLEVLSEVLVSAPPIGPDHTEALVSSHLMEVRVPNIVLLSVGGESAVRVASIVALVGLTNTVSPMEDHSLLF